MVDIGDCYRDRVGTGGRVAVTSLYAEFAWSDHDDLPVGSDPTVTPFTGKTDQGTRVPSSARSNAIRVSRASTFGALYGSFPSGEKCLPADPVATRGLEPPWEQFALPVNRGSFSGESAGEASMTDISGSFDTKGRASGTVSYTDQGDCAIQAHWTARRAG